MITRISSVIRPKGSDLIFDHPYNADYARAETCRDGSAIECRSWRYEQSPPPAKRLREMTVGRIAPKVEPTVLPTLPSNTATSANALNAACLGTYRAQSRLGTSAGQARGGSRLVADTWLGPS